MIQSGSVATPIMCALAPISEASLSNTLITFDDSNKLRILHESTRHAIERRRKTRDRHCQQNASGAQKRAVRIGAAPKWPVQRPR